ncbi:hypothetical protein J437_LFUL013479 [Ladona fulva]|uniref:Uncharacterized protein n=1 Tax=Ladona fulva TaxID=123851 RepID=A0A8K0KGT0_LADFU|nr:hypothetical protein J437_LFUL013479 [Ladona fulva]
MFSTFQDFGWYELREDRKRETARAASQVESIKRDMLQALRGIIPSTSTNSLPVYTQNSGGPSVQQTTQTQGLLQQVPHPLHKHSQSVPASTASLAPPVQHLHTPHFLHAVPQQRSVDLGMLGSESARGTHMTMMDSQLCSHHGSITRGTDRFSYSHGNLSASPSMATTASPGGSRIFLPRQSSHPMPTSHSTSASMQRHYHTQWDLEQMKSELIATLQAELREALREVTGHMTSNVPMAPPSSVVMPSTAQSAAPPHPVPPTSSNAATILPPGSGHLYQTHLYTQL